jgi:hypothetical protein
VIADDGDMLSDDELDEYVSSLLTTQAQRQKASYGTVGFRAFLKGAGKDGPVGKPNTRFLKNIVRDVDQHNNALKMKEERESRDRLKELRSRDGDRMIGYKEHMEGRRGRSKEEDWRERRDRDWTRSRSPDRRHRRERRDGSSANGRERKRSKRDESDDERRSRRPTSERRSRRGSDDESPERHRGRSRERHRSRRDPRSDGFQTRRHSHHTRSSERHSSHPRDRHERRSGRNDSGNEESRHRDNRKSRRSRSSVSPSDQKRSRHHHQRRHSETENECDNETRRGFLSSRRSRLPSPAHRKRSHRTRTASPSSSPQNQRQSPSPPLRSHSPSPSPGPNPPTQGPEYLKHKGRGKVNGGTLDMKFSPTYNPRTDTQPPSPISSSDEGPQDDWGMALRALRKRQEYVLSGAMTERLKETQIEKQEQGEHWPVYPKSKGEREWDRGKVLLNDGSVGVRVAWEKDTPL